MNLVLYPASVLLSAGMKLIGPLTKYRFCKRGPYHQLANDWAKELGQPLESEVENFEFAPIWKLD